MSLILGGGLLQGGHGGVVVVFLLLLGGLLKQGVEALDLVVFLLYFFDFLALRLVAGFLGGFGFELGEVEVNDVFNAGLDGHIVEEEERLSVGSAEGDFVFAGTCGQGGILAVVIGFGGDFAAIVEVGKLDGGTDDGFAVFVLADALDGGGIQRDGAGGEDQHESHE